MISYEELCHALEAQNKGDGETLADPVAQLNASAESGFVPADSAVQEADQLGAPQTIAEPVGDDAELTIAVDDGSILGADASADPRTEDHINIADALGEAAEVAAHDAPTELSDAEKP